MLGFTFLPVVRFFHGVYSPTAPAAPSLRPLVLSGSLVRCQLVQIYHHHRSPVGAVKSSKSGQCSYSACCVLFCFRPGWLLLNVLTFIFHEVSTLRFMISSMRAFLKILLDVLSFLRRSYFFKLWIRIPFMPTWRIHGLLSSVYPPLPCVPSFSWLRWLTAACRPLCRFFSALTVFTAASFLGTSCTAMDFISIFLDGPLSLLSRPSSFFVRPSCLP
jgi:hypothetical protein